MKKFLIVMLMGVLVSTSAVARPRFEHREFSRPQQSHHRQPVRIVKHRKEKPVYSLVAGIVGGVIGGYIASNNSYPTVATQYVPSVYTPQVSYVRPSGNTMTCTTMTVNGAVSQSCTNTSTTNTNVVYF